MINYIEEILIRDLKTLKNEILAFQIPENLWKTNGNVKNSAGVLSQHLCGNLKHFIGAVLGNTGYVRNRELEFSETGLPPQILINNIEETIQNLQDTFKKLNESALHEKYPLPFLGKEVKTGELLLILQSHLAYHLGQINYLRRLLE